MGSGYGVSRGPRDDLEVVHSATNEDAIPPYAQPIEKPRITISIKARRIGYRVGGGLEGKQGLLGNNATQG